MTLRVSSIRSVIGDRLSDQVRKFLVNLSWSLIGGSLASATMLALNILAGRRLGPDSFGQYTLALTISQLIMIPLIFGLDVTNARSIAMAKSRTEREGIISSTLVVIFFNAAIIVLLFQLLNPFISHLLPLNRLLINLSLGLALVMSLKTIVNSFVRGLGLFQFQFFGHLAEALSAAGIFYFLFFWLGRASPSNYIFVLIFSSAVTIIIYLYRLRPSLAALDTQIIRAQLSYSKIIFLSSVLGTTFNSLDKLFIAHFLGIAELGIYGAYYTASTNFIAQLTQMFINVFFPTVAQITDKRGVIRKLNRLVRITLLPSIMILSLVVWLIISLFGGQYPLKMDYVLGFGILAALQVVLTIYSYMITAISKRLYKRYLLYLNLINGGYLLAYVGAAALGFFSISFVIVAMIINVAVTIAAQRYLLSKVGYLNQTE